MPRKTKAQRTAEAAAAAQGQPSAPQQAQAADIVLTPAQSEMLWVLHQTRDYIRDFCKPHVDEEMRLRKAFAASVTPTPVEGTLTVELGAGYRLKLVQPMARTLDEALFGSVWEQDPTLPQDLVGYKPALNMARYNELTAEQRAVFDQCVTTKPGAPQVAVQVPGQPEPTVEE